MNNARRFVYCPTCDRYAWAKVRGVRLFCMECGREALENEENISTPQPDSISSEAVVGVTKP